MGHGESITHRVWEEPVRDGTVRLIEINLKIDIRRALHPSTPLRET